MLSMISNYFSALEEKRYGDLVDYEKGILDGIFFTHAFYFALGTTSALYGAYKG